MAGKQTDPQKQPIFVLDIGTRSIIGIAGHADGPLFQVEAAYLAEHPKRAMIDGQIEDIPQVAKIAGEVKTQLEKELGVSLTHVGVAAAGRALKTQRATGTIALVPTEVITAKTVFSLDMAAVDAARMALEEGPDDPPYYCAGYSVVGYALDGYPFSTILDHHAKQAEVEIIATFLPAEVVASLRRCMELLGLTIDTLTLEPIAAMRAIVPPDVRLLNLALVDIGAGTSDIALSRDGAVSGYTMATVAGDEVTEAIIRHCLVDFDTAERIKVSLAEDKSIPYHDVLGMEHNTPAEDILNAVQPAIDLLAQVVADKILECNGGTPAAVFLVGGGSRTPGIAPLLAEKLGLEKNKIAIGGNHFSGTVLNRDAGLDGPEFATPVGIALIAQEEADTAGASVLINGTRVRLFTAESTSIMDALLIAGYNYSDLMGRNGRSLSFVLNSLPKTVRGGHYTVAQLRLNGEDATLQTRVENDDVIEITPAVSGTDATAQMRDFAADVSAFAVTLNGQPQTAGFSATRNGLPAEANERIEPQDDVEIISVRTVQDLCEAAGFAPTGLSVTVNGRPADPGVLLQPGDDVQINGKPALPIEPEPPSKSALKTPAKKAAAENRPDKPAPVKPTQADPVPPTDKINEPAAAAAKNSAPLPAAGAPAVSSALSAPPTPSAANAGGSLRIELNGKTVVLPPKADGQPHLLYDMLELVDIDPSKPKGTVVIQINGADASYLEPLSGGDTVDIHWAEE